MTELQLWAGAQKVIVCFYLEFNVQKNLLSDTVASKCVLKANMKVAEPKEVVKITTTTTTTTANTTNTTTTTTARASMSLPLPSTLSLVQTCQSSVT